MSSNLEAASESGISKSEGGVEPTDSEHGEGRFRSFAEMAERFEFKEGVDVFFEVPQEDGGTRVSKVRITALPNGDQDRIVFEGKNGERRSFDQTYILGLQDSVLGVGTMTPEKKDFLEKYEQKLKEAEATGILKLGEENVSAKTVIRKAREAIVKADEKRFKELQAAAERQYGPLIEEGEEEMTTSEVLQLIEESDAGGEYETIQQIIEKVRGSNPNLATIIEEHVNTFSAGLGGGVATVESYVAKKLKEAERMTEVADKDVVVRAQEGAKRLIKEQARQKEDEVGDNDGLEPTDLEGKEDI